MESAIGKMTPINEPDNFSYKEFEVSWLTYASSSGICGYKVCGDYFSCNPEFWFYTSYARSKT